MPPDCSKGGVQQLPARAEPPVPPPRPAPAPSGGHRTPEHEQCGCSFPAREQNQIPNLGEGRKTKPEREAESIAKYKTGQIISFNILFIDKRY